MRFDDGLLEALYEGMRHSPLWSDFLSRLKAATGAELTMLSLRPAEAGEALALSAGEGPVVPLRQLLANVSLRPGRCYALEELLELCPPALMADLDARLRADGVRHVRVVHVVEPGGVGAWLACAGGRTSGGGAGAGTAALLSALAGHLRIALRHFSELEREQFRAAVTGQAFSRLKIGWLTLDAQCRIVEATDNVEEMFQWSTLLRRGRYDRLTPASPLLDRQLTAFVKEVSTGRDVRPFAATVSRDPWVDLLVAPLPGQTPGQTIAGRRSATAIVYVSGDRRSQADRCDQLVDLFGLLPSEARLAWLLAQATGIADAAEALGLTVETARNYSKKIYAKTGARGQADLVRIVMTSVLALS